MKYILATAVLIAAILAWVAISHDTPSPPIDSRATNPLHNTLATSTTSTQGDTHRRATVDSSPSHHIAVLVRVEANSVTSSLLHEVGSKSISASLTANGFTATLPVTNLSNNGAFSAVINKELVPKLHDAHASIHVAIRTPHLKGSATKALPPDLDKHLEIGVALDRRPALFGRIVTQNGVAVSEAQVMATIRERSETTRLSTHSRGDGRFYFDGERLAGHPVVIRASHPGHGHSEAQLPATNLPYDSGDLALSLMPEIHIQAGFVGGTLARNLPVKITGKRKSDGVRIITRSKTDEHGTARLHNLPPGDYVATPEHVLSGLSEDEHQAPPCAFTHPGQRIVHLVLQRPRIVARLAFDGSFVEPDKVLWSVFRNPKDMTPWLEGGVIHNPWSLLQVEQWHRTSDIVVPLGAAIWVKARYGDQYGGGIVLADEPRTYTVNLHSSNSLGNGILEIAEQMSTHTPSEIGVHSTNSLRPHLVSLTPIPAPEPVLLESTELAFKYAIPAGRYLLKVVDANEVQCTIKGTDEIFVQPNATVKVSVERPPVARCRVLLVPPDKYGEQLLGRIRSVSLAMIPGGDAVVARPILQLTSKGDWVAVTQPVCGRPLCLGEWHGIGTYRLQMRIDGYVPVDTVVRVSGDEEPAVVPLVPK